VLASPASRPGSSPLCRLWAPGLESCRRTSPCSHGRSTRAPGRRAHVLRAARSPRGCSTRLGGAPGTTAIRGDRRRCAAARHERRRPRSWPHAPAATRCGSSSTACAHATAPPS
jgi:hypothetical protein